MSDASPMTAADPAGRGFARARPFLEARVAAFAGAPHHIHLDCDPALELPAADLASVGMIVDEAVSNALAHAFPVGREGQIWIRLFEARGRLTLAVRDNGIGMPDLPPDPLRGRGRIERFARQLGGYARLGSAPFGGGLASVVFQRNG